jgi:hypothetical protein
MAFLRGEMLALLLAAATGSAGAPAVRTARFHESAIHAESLPGSPPGDATGVPGHAAEAARRILEEGGYQKSLPLDTPPATVDWDLGPFAALIRILLWTALAVVVVLAVVWVVNRIGGRPREGEAEAGTGAPGPLEVPLDSAERLATAGRFAEAIHVLLLETLAALSRAAQLAPSLTSREIVARVPLPARAREALAGLVLAVEVSRFGGTPAGERDYRDCLDRFHAFIETYRRGAETHRRGAQRAEGAPA